MPPLRGGRVYVNRSVSFPPHLLLQARERARRLGLSFSAYVQQCVVADLARGGPFVVHETYPELPLDAPEAAEDAPREE